MERVLELSLGQPEGWRRIMAELAVERPELRAAELLAAVARAAHAIEETFAENDAAGPVPWLHRLAARIALDAWTAAERDWPAVRVRELVAQSRPG